MNENERCPECGSWGEECAFPNAQANCGCARCLRVQRDEARAEAETLRAAIDGEPWGAAVLKQQRDEAVKRLGITLEQLWATEKQRDEARAALKGLAERQREACAERLYALLTEKKATAVWVGADEIRATPLVTEEDK